MSISLLVGTKVMQEFIKDIEALCGDQIKIVDIGGGLSTSYTEPNEPQEFSYQNYRDYLNKEVINRVYIDYMNHT